MEDKKDNYVAGLVASLGTSILLTWGVVGAYFGSNTIMHKREINNLQNAIQTSYNLDDCLLTNVVLTFNNNKPKALINGFVSYENESESIGLKYNIPYQTSEEQFKYNNLIAVCKQQNSVDLNNIFNYQIFRQLTTLVNEETPIEIYGNYNFNADENTL